MFFLFFLNSNSYSAPYKTKKLVSFILKHVITIDYDGKKESYIFTKVNHPCNGFVCTKHIYEVREGTKLVGKGMWFFDKMSTSNRKKKDKSKYEADLSNFANLNNKLKKNSIKLSGYKKIYLQVDKKQDRVSTYAWVPGRREDPKKNKKDDKINREILKITLSVDFAQNIPEEERAVLKNNLVKKKKKDG